MLWAQAVVQIRAAAQVQALQQAARRKHRAKVLVARVPAQRLAV